MINGIGELIGYELIVQGREAVVRAGGRQASRMCCSRTESRSGSGNKTKERPRHTCVPVINTIPLHAGTIDENVVMWQDLFMI
jgi:hypothetical protein